MIRLMISSMGSTASQNLVHALRGDQEPWWILGGDMRPTHGGLGLCDHDATTPPGKRIDDYVERLLELHRVHRLHAFVPVMEAELEATRRGRAPLHAAGLRVLLSDDLAITTCRSKRALNLIFENCNMRTAAFGRPQGPFPLFARPNDGSGSRGATIVRSAGDVLSLPVGDYVFNQLLSGVEVSIDGFADTNHNVRQLVARTRDEVRGGLATISTIISTPDGLDSKIKRLSDDLGLVGFFNVQLKLDPKSGPTFFDVNPRLGGAMILSFQGGLAAGPLMRAWLGQTPWPTHHPPTVGLQLHRRWHNVFISA